MANKGTFKGKTIMSVETWEKFHSNWNEQFDQSWIMRGQKSTYTKGGAYVHYHDDCTQFGYVGYGGCFFRWDPKDKLSFAYNPADSVPAVP